MPAPLPKLHVIPSTPANKRTVPALARHQATLVANSVLVLCACRTGKEQREDSAQAVLEPAGQLSPAAVAAGAAAGRAACSSNIGLQLVNPQIMRSFIDTAKTGSGLDVAVAVGAALYRRGPGAADRLRAGHLCQRERGLDGDQRPARRPGRALPAPGHVLSQCAHAGRDDRAHRRRHQRAVQLFLPVCDPGVWQRAAA